jgi:hypothetical protein
MFEQLFYFIESYAGVSFDPYDTLSCVDVDLVFEDPYAWKSYLDTTIDNVMELLNTLEEHRQDVPDDLGDVNEVKNSFAHQIVGEIIDEINKVKNKLNLEITKMKGLDGLRSNITLITNLIQFCKENTFDDILEKHKFLELNDTNDKDMTKVLGIVEQDIMNIYQIVTDTCELLDDEM